MSLPEELSPTPPAEAGERPQPAGPVLDADHRHETTAASMVPGRTWALILGAGLLAGLISFGIGEAAPSYFSPSNDLPPEIAASGQLAAGEMERRMKSSRDQAAAMAYGGLGLMLGLALGAAGGMARRSAGSAIKAAVIGLVLGGVTGAGATLILLPSYHAARASATDEEVTSDLALALRTHGGIWISIGAAAGLALGLGLGGGARTARATVGGILGACLAAAIYEFAGALVFPMAETFRPVAVSAGPRLLAHIGVALCVAAVACWAALHLQLRRADPGRAP